MAIGQKDYQERIERKREYYETQASKNTEKALTHGKAARDILDIIPLGQPILVGHHSEKRHRRDIERIDSRMRKAKECADKADYYGKKAERTGTSGAISSDNPEALMLIEKEIAKLKEKHALNKAIRAYYRKHGTCKGLPELKGNEAAEKEFDDIIKNGKYGSPMSWYCLPYLNAEIKRLEARAAQLRRIDAMGEETLENEAGIVAIDNDINRVTVKLHERNRDLEQSLKHNGFHWSRTNMQWQRLKTSAALSAAKQIIGLN